VSHIAEVDLAMYALRPDALAAGRRAEIAAHLAECAACQGTHDFFAVSEEVLDAELREETTWEPLTGSATQRVLMEYGALVAKEDQEAEELLQPYLDNPISAAWQMLVRRRRFRTGGVVRGLIRAAHDVCESDPLAALTFAENAIVIAEGVDLDGYPSSAIDQLRGTAWKELAVAQMLLGRFPEALAALDRAERHHRRYRPNGLGLSLVALIRGGVLYEQGHLDDAMSWAERAEHGFAHVGEDRRRMDALFLRGAILFEAGRATEALPLFGQAIDYGEEVQNVRIVARGSYATADCQLALGNLNEASVHYHRARVIFREVGPKPDLVATEWGIARIFLRVGNYDEAIRRLRDVSTEFERRQMVTDAALVGLDIVEALLALNKPRRIVALAQHLYSVFTNVGMLTGALTAIAYLKEAALRGELTVDNLAKVRSFIRRAARQPNLEFVRPARPVEDSV
jgi:tetratricopeptide (TPR) repeat protein